MTIAVENARKKKKRIEKDTRKRVNTDATNGVMNIVMMKAVIAAILDRDDVLMMMTKDVIENVTNPVEDMDEKMTESPRAKGKTRRNEKEAATRINMRKMIEEAATMRLSATAIVLIRLGRENRSLGESKTIFYRRLIRV